MASWNCCPAGEPTTSDSLLQMQAGDTAYGSISVDYDNQVATVVSSYRGQNVTLTVTGELRDFNWLDVTLEVYTVSTCSDFAGSDMVITNMSAKTQSGAPLIPEWVDATGETACNGKQTNTATSWSVHHDDDANIDMFPDGRGASA